MAQRTILALDIGHVRTGVARAFLDVKIASPLKTIQSSENLVESVAKLVVSENAAAIVIGLPRNLSGDDTDQTRYVREQSRLIQDAVAVPVHFIDEALTSHKAETELTDRQKPFRKEDIDMLSATYILEDFLSEHPEVIVGV